MTARQRAKHGDIQEFMKLSDGTYLAPPVSNIPRGKRQRLNADTRAEVQVKRVFTAEEHAMRRAEMARRRRNLSDKRNEEVKVSISTEGDGQRPCHEMRMGG